MFYSAELRRSNQIWSSILLEKYKCLNLEGVAVEVEAQGAVGVHQEVVLEEVAEEAILLNEMVEEVDTEEEEMVSLEEGVDQGNYLNRINN